MQLVRRSNRRGFTLVEAMVSTSITALAGSAVLLGIATSITTTDDILERVQAAGIARQLMDEIAGQLYCEDSTNPYQYPLGAFGVSRDQYNDIDDYAGYSAQPAKDRWGFALGSEDAHGGQRDPNFRLGANYFANWQQTVSVYYVSATNPSQALAAGQTSAYRAVEVKILYHDSSGATRPLASLRRVFCYVPNQ